MRTTPALLLAALLAAPPAARASEAEVRETVLAFNRAYERNDLDAYFGFYAPDATVQWWPDGRRPVSAYRSEWEALIGSGARVTQNRVVDLEIRMNPSGDVGVATYRVEVTTRGADGAETTEEALETDVLFHRDGAWSVVHVHYQTR